MGGDVKVFCDPSSLVQLRSIDGLFCCWREEREREREEGKRGEEELGASSSLLPSEEERSIELFRPSVFRNPDKEISREE